MVGYWIAWTGMSPRWSWRRFSVFCGAAWMASDAVLWFGEDTSAVALRNNRAAASSVRTVSVLGATGSIGDSTMDLLRTARERYQVEALTAHTNVQALAKLAKEFGARFAAVVAPTPPPGLKNPPAGPPTPSGAGGTGPTRAGAPPAGCATTAPRRAARSATPPS